MAKECKTLPDWVVWVWHIAIAGALMAMGSIMIQKDVEEKEEPMHIGWAIFLIVVASLAVFYHGGWAVHNMVNGKYF